MLRIIIIAASSLLLVSPVGGAAVQVMASGDTAPIAMDDIEGAKSARLMKNKEDIDVQSTYHEEDIKDTGDVPDELAARLVKNRGPITAKIMASGSHKRYCKGDDNNCSVKFSLVAWKFAGDKGTVHGTIGEKFEDDGEEMKAEVDCMVRNGNEAIVGGVVREGGGDRHPAGRTKARRAYVRVVDGDDTAGDFVSEVFFDDGVDFPHCGAPGMADNFEVVDPGKNVVDPRVSVCSKHGDWEECLEKMKVEQAVQ